MKASKAARARQAALRVLLAERQCRRAELRRTAAHADVKAAYIELGEALLAQGIGKALKLTGRK